MIVIPASLRSDFIHMAGMTIHIALESTIHIVGIRMISQKSYWPSNNSSSDQTTVTYGNGNTDVYTIDFLGHVAGYQFNVGTNSLQGVVGWFPYGLFSGVTVTDGFNAANTQSCAVGYDFMLRINSVQCTTPSVNIWGQNFTYDRYGNLNKSVLDGYPGDAFLPDYTAATNHYTLGGCTVSYDASGNLLNDCLNTYTWDGYNSLATMNSKTLTFDALSREVEIGVGSAYTQVLYGPGSLGKLGLMNGQVPHVTRFPLPGGSTAEITGTGGTNHILHSDWRGSSPLSTNYKLQTAENDTSYAPFGEAYNNTNGTADFNFTGMMQDTGGMGGGLYDFPYREYSIVGRWINPDPSGLNAVDPTNPQTWNRYAYVMNNPLSNVDPLGLQAPWQGVNVQCANGQNPAICQGGYGVPGGLWYSIGGGLWDQLDGFQDFTGEGGENDWSIVRPPLQPCYIFVQVCGANGQAQQNKVSATKSPARKQCEQNAQNTLSHAKLSAAISSINTVGWASIMGGAVNFGAGCVTGAAIGGTIGVLATPLSAGASDFVGAPVGCVTGGVSAALEGLPTNLVMASAGASAEYAMKRSEATNAYNTAMSACTQIP
jgi:RHS repeat-associated protein